MNAKDLIDATEVRRRCDAPPRDRTAALPLLVGHSSLSGLGGQRLVSVIQYIIVGPLRAHAARWLLASGMMDSHLLVVSGVK